MTHLCVWPQWSQVTFEVATCHQLHDNQCRLALRNNTKQPNLAEEKQMFSTSIQAQLIIIYSCWYVALWERSECRFGSTFWLGCHDNITKLKYQIPTSVRADMPGTAWCQWAPGLDESQPHHILRTHHMVTVELLHHRGLVQELDPLAHAGRLIDRLDGHPGLWLILHHSLGYSLVHHPKGALPKLPAHGDLLPGHLPLIWNIHWGEREQAVMFRAGITPCSPQQFWCSNPTQKAETLHHVCKQAWVCPIQTLLSFDDGIQINLKERWTWSSLTMVKTLR